MNNHFLMSCFTVIMFHTNFLEIIKHLCLKNYETCVSFSTTNIKGVPEITRQYVYIGCLYRLSIRCTGKANHAQNQVFAMSAGSHLK